MNASRASRIRIEGMLMPLIFVIPTVEVYLVTLAMGDYSLRFGGLRANILHRRFVHFVLRMLETIALFIDASFCHIHSAPPPNISC